MQGLPEAALLLGVSYLLQARNSRNGGKLASDAGEDRKIIGLRKQKKSIGTKSSTRQNHLGNDNILAKLIPSTKKP